MEQARVLRSELDAHRGRAATNLLREQARATIFSRGSSSARQARQLTVKDELENLRRKSASFEQNLEELAPQIDAAKQRLDFLTEEYQKPAGRLSEPARRMREGCLSARSFGGGRRSRLLKRARNCSKSGCTGSRSAIFCCTCLQATSCGRFFGGLLPADPLAATEESDRAAGRAEAHRDDSRAVPGAQNFDEAIG